MTENKLNKKNSNYLFKLKKQLSKSGLKEENLNSIYNSIENELITNQKKGIPANKMYGSPTFLANSIKENNGKVKNYLISDNVPRKKNNQKTNNVAKILSDFKKSDVAIDTSLSLFILFTALIGILSLFSPSKTEENLGITSIAMVSIFAGLIYTWVIYKVTPTKDKIVSRGEQTIYATIGIIFYMAIFIFSNYIPRIINPVLSGKYLLIVSMIALLIWYIWSKNYGLNSGFLSISRLSNNQKSKFLNKRK